MIWFIAGLVIFFGTHLFSAFRSRLEGRDLRRQLGAPAFMVGYGVVALVGFVLIVWGYGEARPGGLLYTAPVWGRHLNYILMPIALIMLVAAYAPTGHIAKTLKHPMLAAVKLWAVGHLLANGETVAVILFGSFLAYAVLARIMAKRRGDIGAGAATKVSAVGDLIAIGVGLGVSAALILWLHPILFGVAVWPPS